MERLLQPSSSSKIFPSKFPSKTSPFIPRLRLSTLGFVSSYRPESLRVSSISCSSFENPSAYTLIRANKTKVSFNGSSQLEESKPNPGFLQRITTNASGQPKALSTRTVILIAAVAALLLNPLLAPPAFASFQTAAKSGWLTSACMDRFPCWLLTYTLST